MKRFTDQQAQAFFEFINGMEDKRVDKEGAADALAKPSAVVLEDMTERDEGHGFIMFCGPTIPIRKS